MKFCDKCNVSYVDDFQYCPQCGSLLAKSEREEPAERPESKLKWDEL